MSDFLSLLLSFVLLYKYWFLFATMFASSILVPIPVSGLILATGAFISLGYFDFFISLISIVLGNILGDCTDFFLAKKYGRKIINLLHVREPKYLEQLEIFLKKHPGPSIFFTRFVGTIEILTSLLSGFIGISFKTFLFYDFLGNLFSDGAILFLGYYLGIHWQDFITFLNISNYIFLVAIIVSVLSIIIWRKKHN